MTQKADEGDIVDQQAVPILPDDSAFEVFKKVTVAAEIVLWRSLPALIDGTARRTPQDPAAASYFGRRRPENGRIDWSADAKTIHDLVRAVAPPYPGAYTLVHGRKLRILKTTRETARARRTSEAALYVENGGCYADCGGGGVLRVLDADLDGEPIAPAALYTELGLRAPIRLDERAGLEIFR